MKTLRILVVWLVIVGMGTSAFAGDLRDSIAKAATEQSQTADKPIPKGYLWAGSALFVGGMAVGIYAFLHNRNGTFPEFNEATATNKPLGAAGLGAAFVGGTILFLGTRKNRGSPALTFGPREIGVAKQLTW